MFDKIGEIERQELEAKLYKDMVEDYRQDNVRDDYYEFIFPLQKNTYKTVMSDSELKEAIVCAIDLLEEMKKLNNEGLTKEVFEEKIRKIDEGIKSEDKDFTEIYSRMLYSKIISNDRIIEIKSKIAQVCRVGGAYWMLMSLPVLNDSLYVIYEVVVDSFDGYIEETPLYEVCAFMLLRCIMSLHSQEIKTEDEENADEEKDEE